jgi:membrane fusion protein
MSSLFRTAAIQAHQQRLVGDVVLSQPRSLAVTTIFIAVSVISIAAFLATGTYARKETVAGVLSPKAGTIKIMAPTAGIVDQLYASEGMAVDEGTALVALRDERLSGAGRRIGEEMKSTVNAQLLEIGARRLLEQNRLVHEQKKLATEIAGLEAEQNALNRQLEIQGQLLADSASRLNRTREIATEGYISEEDLAARNRAHLTNRQLQANLQQKSAAINSQLAQLRLAIEQLPIESADRVSRISSLESDLRLKVLELEHRGAFTITAPVAGIVTAIQAVPGAFADPRVPLLTLLPADNTLEAHLFVPTRAIGFVDLGQDVRLLYDAFDYRRFGTYSGRVTEISSAVFLPAEISSVIRTAEPTYRITVSIPEQVVSAYGRDYSLQAGMLLQADIILERRSLLDWIFDPLFSLRGRT